MSVPIAVDVQGADEVNRRLQALLTGIEDTRPLMDKLGGAIVTQTKFRFEDQKGPDGTPWQQSHRAIEQSAEGRPGKTLILDEHLFDSLLHLAHADSVEVGSRRVYAAIHQFGGQAGRGGTTTLPARPYLGIDADDARQIEEIVGRYLTEALQ